MPSGGDKRGVDSPWGQLSFEPARYKPTGHRTSASEPGAECGSGGHGTPEGGTHGSPALTSNGKRRASRAAQFMPFAALTGYYELIREQEILAQQRAEKNRERWEEAP